MKVLSVKKLTKNGKMSIFINVNALSGKQIMTTSSALDVLESVPCFAGLSPKAKEWLLNYVVEQSFAKGEVIILEGEPCPGVFVIKLGSVKLYRASSEGEEQIVRVVHRGGCFECAPLFDKGPNPMSAQALEATKVCLLPASAFQSVLSTQPQALLAILSILATRLRFLLNMVEDFSFRRVPSRLAKLLYQLSERQGKTLVVSPSLSLTQQHLACMLGCSRQAVNSSLRKLVSENIIRMEGHRIVVLKPEALKRIS